MAALRVDAKPSQHWLGCEAQVRENGTGHLKPKATHHLCVLGIAKSSVG